MDNPGWNRPEHASAGAECGAGSGTATIARMTETLPAPALPRSELNLVWLDCEMSGLNPESERLLEIAVVVTDPQLQIRVEGPVLVIHQPQALLDGMDAWNKGTHGRSGLIQKVQASTLTEAEADEIVAILVPLIKDFLTSA